MFCKKPTIYFIVLIGTLWTSSVFSMDLIVALDIKDDQSQIPQVLKDTKLANYQYPGPRHITLMWVKNLDGNVKSQAEKALCNIANNFFKKKEIEFAQKGGWRYISDQVKRFGPGGLYLAPTAYTQNILNELYQELHKKVKELNLENKIHQHLKIFTPHVTLAEANAANNYLKNSIEIKVFLDKANSNLANLTTPLAKKASLKIEKAHCWFQGSSF